MLPLSSYGDTDGSRPTDLPQRQRAVRDVSIEWVYPCTAAERESGGHDMGSCRGYYWMWGRLDNVGRLDERNNHLSQVLNLAIEPPRRRAGERFWLVSETSEQ